MHSVNVITFDFIFFKYNQGQKLMTKRQFFSRVTLLFFECNEALLGRWPGHEVYH